MIPENREAVLQELRKTVETNLTFLAPPEGTWQPADFLPDSGEGWMDQMGSFRASCAGLSDDLVAVLCGNVVTEEALPSYHAWLSNLEGGLDPTGRGECSFGRWTRYWVADEQKHGSVLSKFLYLSGRVNMKAFETTVHNLIRNGFDPSTNRCLTKGFVYTSFQEAATRIAHGNVAKLARKEGCEPLAKMLEAIAADEARHETAYTRFVGRLLELDPEGTIVAMSTMLERGIEMPGRTMDDGTGDTKLFAMFSAAAQRLHVYTTRDYVDLVERNLRRWAIFEKRFTSEAGQRAQEAIAVLMKRLGKLADRAERQASAKSTRPFRWVATAVSAAPATA